MPERRGLVIGGLALLGLGGYLLVSKQTSGSPGGGTLPAGAVTSCMKNTHSSPDCRLVQPSQFYNWSDLRSLPLNPSDPHNWSTGGTTTELGMRLGASLWYTEAKYGSADDGTTGWFLRIANPGMVPGDWALPAQACGVPRPCG